MNGVKKSAGIELVYPGEAVREPLGPVAGRLKLITGE
jgi:hypothetical protein